MIFAAHQPNFIPWVPFWVKVDVADVFGLMYQVQYSKGAYHNRTRIREREDAWLSIPVTANLGQRLDEVQIAENARPDKIAKRLTAAYSKRRFWISYGTELLDLISYYTPGQLLYTANAKVLYWLTNKLGIGTTIFAVESSDPDPSEALARWCEEHSCATYLSGSGAANYLHEAPFAKRGVTVEYSRPIVQPKYATTSILTALFDLGPDWRTCHAQQQRVKYFNGND